MDHPEQVLAGWKKLVSGYPWFERPGAFLLPAYSEFMPAPRLGISMIGEIDAGLFTDEDPFGWQVMEFEEIKEIQPGLEAIASQLMRHMVKLAREGSDAHLAGHAGGNLHGNPYWPPELAEAAARLEHERFVLLLPLALAKTQDDKGRVAWTCFGGSERDPEHVFWRSFFTAPGSELPAGEALSFFSRLLNLAYGLNSKPEELASVGFRILPGEDASVEDGLPSWAKNYRVDGSADIKDVRYLLTFRPFGRLPEHLRRAYLAGRLNLLPFPGSLVFWGMPTYQRLQRELPLAGQIPLQRLLSRHQGPDGLRVPQTGWLHNSRPGKEGRQVHPDLLAHTFTRTHRWDRIHRFEDELTAGSRVENVLKVLFSTDLEVMGLYDKPMARNCQIWSEDFDLILDGPRAGEKELHRAEAVLAEGGLFGYRFQYPAMLVGRHEVYWHRPLVACLPAGREQPQVVPGAPPGWMTAYPVDTVDLASPAELWPRLLRRPEYSSAIQDFHSPHDHYAHQTAINLLELFDAWRDLDKQPLSRDLARQLVHISKEKNLDEWLASLVEHAGRVEAARPMQELITTLLAPLDLPETDSQGITYSRTARREFELAYWEDIHKLAHGQFRNKDNADCVDDPVSVPPEERPHRDLDALANYLLARHRWSIEQAGMQGQARVGDLPFRWRTDFDFPRFGGWKSNQEGDSQERDLLVIIPGRDHLHPVILADHYDTAYMEDLYEKSRGGSGVRRAAAGADDNYSATAVLLQAAPIYLDLARQDRLDRDIWLLHLTGEEFPADCLGARHFCQSLIERTLRLRIAPDEWLDLTAARPAGIVLMDMIAHNRDQEKDIFQISPGKSPSSTRLARQAHLANQAWNQGTFHWNRHPDRLGRGRGQRSPDNDTPPEIAEHMRLSGEIRLRDDPESSLYNTDGQIFSDIGAPVVLLMENYDINRSGYHDSHDTMVNIDLDFGSALAAIAIETVARVATGGL